MYADAQVTLDAAVPDRLAALDALAAAHEDPDDSWPGRTVRSVASAAALAPSSGSNARGRTCEG